MNKNRQVPMMICLSQAARDKLRILAAEQNLRNTNRVTSAATIARELILDGIEKIEHMEAQLAPDINRIDVLPTKKLERGVGANENAD